MTSTRLTTLYAQVKARFTRGGAGESREIGRGSDWLMVLGIASLIALGLVVVGVIQYMHTFERGGEEVPNQGSEFSRERELLNRVQGLYGEREGVYTTELSREGTPTPATPPTEEVSPEPPTPESGEVELVP